MDINKSITTVFLKIVVAGLFIALGISFTIDYLITVYQ